MQNNRLITNKCVQFVEERQKLSKFKCNECTCSSWEKTDYIVVKGNLKMHAISHKTVETVSVMTTTHYAISGKNIFSLMLVYLCFFFNYYYVLVLKFDSVTSKD